MPKTKTCKWKFDEDYCFWETECGGAFNLFEGTPAENHMLYCTYCGERIEEAKEKLKQETENGT